MNKSLNKNVADIMFSAVLPAGAPQHLNHWERVTELILHTYRKVLGIKIS